MAEKKLLLRARNLSKIYPPREKPLALMAGLLAGGSERRGFAALHDAGLSLRAGEALAVIGRNGAGKSTLLQLVCGVRTPTTGSVERFGRVAAMLELGAGFNPDFTGRENVFLSASIHGLRDREIDERFDRIAAFADLGEFLDRPVAEYSSGMHARLAFAVCAHVDADILVVDEVLGVGDAAFQVKCRQFLERFLRRGAVIFVSHDESAVLGLCERAIWLEQGRVMADGPAEAVVRRYRLALSTGESSAPADAPEAEALPPLPEIADPRVGSNPIEVSPFLPDAPQHGHGGAVIDDVYFSDAEERRLDVLQGGTVAALNIRGAARAAVVRPILGFILRDEAGQNLFGDNTFLAYRDRPQALLPGDRFHAILEFRMPLLPLGTYAVAPSIIDGTQEDHVQLFWMEEALLLTVRRSPVRLGAVGVPIETTVSLRAPTDAALP